MYSMCPWFVQGCAPDLKDVSLARVIFWPGSCGLPSPKMCAAYPWFLRCAPAPRGVPLALEVCPWPDSCVNSLRGVPLAQEPYSLDSGILLACAPVTFWAPLWGCSSLIGGANASIGGAKAPPIIYKSTHMLYSPPFPYPTALKISH